jgi:hypothetical protein
VEVEVVNEPLVWAPVGYELEREREGEREREENGGDGE